MTGKRRPHGVRSWPIVHVSQLITKTMLVGVCYRTMLLLSLVEGEARIAEEVVEKARAVYDRAVKDGYRPSDTDGGNSSEEQEVGEASE